MVTNNQLKDIILFLHCQHWTWVEGGKQPLSADELDEMFKEEQLQEKNEKTYSQINNSLNVGENFPVFYKVNSVDTKGLVK